jgi:AraC-like DNA-binding protein
LCKKITFLEYWDEFYQILQFLWILGFIRSAFLHLFGGLLGIMRKAIILDVDHETNSSIQIEKNRANSQFNIVTTEANRNCDSQEEISKVWKTIEKLLTQEKLYLNDSLTIADLSKECNETVSLISRAIHQYKGLNFNTYVNYKRVEYAQALLLQEESWSIEYIGKKAGFKSNSAFYRAFHLQSNMTPRKFQQLNTVSSS